MNTYILKRLIVAGSVLLMFASLASAQSIHQCSNATLHGSFGYTSTGNLLESFVPAPDFGPFAEVGRQTFDGKGNTDATATVSSNGDIGKVSVQGTYVVNPDCTGSMTLNVSPFGIVVTADLVIDNDGREIRAIVTNTGGVIESRVYRKQFSKADHDIDRNVRDDQDDH